MKSNMEKYEKCILLIIDSCLHRYDIQHVTELAEIFREDFNLCKLSVISQSLKHLNQGMMSKNSVSISRIVGIYSEDGKNSYLIKIFKGLIFDLVL